MAQLRAAGVERLFQEKSSGATTHRPKLDHLLALLRPGDPVAIVQLNRLGRNSNHVSKLVTEMPIRQVRFVVLA